MTKRKILNILLIGGIAVVLVAFAFTVRVRASADSYAVLKTSGMTCGSCSYKISRVLQKEKGVASVKVDVDQGVVVVGYDSKAQRPEVFAEQVTGIGYGSRVMGVLSPEQYQKIAGGAATAQKPGCACCNK
ncbi:MAG: heavy-metal-associated domain-containing protein [Geobacter sp.]|nr:heavy-metal-associated domain-containing protein [Geobacter sp.]